MFFWFMSELFDRFPNFIYRVQLLHIKIDRWVGEEKGVSCLGGFCLVNFLFYFEKLLSSCFRLHALPCVSLV